MNQVKLNLTLPVTLLCINLMLVACGASQYGCTDPLGCLEIPPGSPVVIGAILATSGDQRPTGTVSMDQVKKAIADKGDIFGHPVLLINYGTDCTTGSAQTAATEFATNSDLAAAVGPTCSEEEIAASEILLNAGIPLVGPVLNSTSAYSITNQVLSAIQQVVVLMPDQTMYIPRQALLFTLGLAP